MQRILIKRIKFLRKKGGIGYRYVLKCLNCSKTFYLSASYFNNGQGKFCSRRCSCGFQKRKGHTNVKCLNCGRKFEVNKCYLRRGGGKYCSLKCYHASQKGKPTWNKNLTKEIDERLRLLSEKHKGKHYSSLTEFKKGNHCDTEWKKGEHPSPKTEFKKGHPPTKGFTEHHQTEEVKKIISEANKGKIVTQETRKKLSVFQLGSKHWNWKDGITPLSIQIRNSNKYKHWRISIFQKDDHTCQLCGIKGMKGLGRRVKLEAHHLVDFSSILNEIRYAYPDGKITYERALKYKFLWDLENGITLCQDCHIHYHLKQFK